MLRQIEKAVHLYDGSFPVAFHQFPDFSINSCRKYWSQECVFDVQFTPCRGVVYLSLSEHIGEARCEIKQL